MRVSKSAGAGIVKASRVSRGRQRKLKEAQKKALASLKAAKKSLTKLKADIKTVVKQYAGHMVKVEECYQRVDELGGSSPYIASNDWEDSLMSDLETEIVRVYEEIEGFEEDAKDSFK